VAHTARIIPLSALMLWASLLGGAQQPDVVHARLESRPVGAGLEKEFRAVVQSDAGPAWIGYAMPLVPGDHHMCCSGCEPWGDHPENLARRCGLEGGSSFNLRSGEPEGVELEGPKRMWVLFRVAQARVMKIRVFSHDCRLDAGGLPLHWLTGVQARESVEFLSGWVRETKGKSDDDDVKFLSGWARDANRKSDDDDRETHTAQGALAAIALTDDPAADWAFDRFAAADSPEAVRAHATFWLGEARGLHGFELLKRIVQEDASERVREQAVFGLSVSKQPGALQALIDAAHQGSAGVRGQAIFWLAQKAGSKAAKAITAAIEDDPETEVKKRAVFALSLMPAEEGVPLLIKVAQTNRNPEVRRQAIFWLGQSKDQRAWAFIEDILTP